MEAAACKSANFTKRLRLSHIRRLARSLNHLGGEAIGNHQVVADVITKGDANNTCCKFYNVTANMMILVKQELVCISSFFLLFLLNRFPNWRF